MKKIFHCFLKIFISYSCPNFFPCCSPLLHPLHCSLNQSPPCCPLPWVLYRCSLPEPTPSFPNFSSVPSPLVTVNLFLISTQVVLFCSFVCFVHTVLLIGEITLLFFFLTLYLFTFRERGRKREKHQCVVVSSAPPTGDLAPDMCLDWELNWRPFGSQANTQSTQPLASTRDSFNYSLYLKHCEVPIVSLYQHLIFYRFFRHEFQH